MNMPPTPTPATAFEPSMPIQAISVMLYRVPINDDAMIGSASFTSVFMIGPFVKLPFIVRIPFCVLREKVTLNLGGDTGVALFGSVYSELVYTKIRKGRGGLFPLTLQYFTLQEQTIFRAFFYRMKLVSSDEIVDVLHRAGEFFGGFC